MPKDSSTRIHTNRRRDIWTNRKNEPSMEKETKKPRRPRMKTLFIETLKKMGCPYQKGNDKNEILVKYQGEKFVMCFYTELPYVRIWDLGWKAVLLEDLDEVARMRRAINKVNGCGCATAYYSIDKECGYMDVHAKSTILFIPEIPNLEKYLTIELNDFFHLHDEINKVMNELRLEDREKGRSLS